MQLSTSLLISAVLSRALSIFKILNLSQATSIIPDIRIEGISSASPLFHPQNEFITPVNPQIFHPHPELPSTTNLKAGSIAVEKTVIDLALDKTPLTVSPDLYKTLEKASTSEEFDTAIEAEIKAKGATSLDPTTEGFSYSDTLYRAWMNMPTSVSGARDMLEASIIKKIVDNLLATKLRWLPYFVKASDITRRTLTKMGRFLMSALCRAKASSSQFLRDLARRAQLMITSTGTVKSWVVHGMVESICLTKGITF